MAHLLIIVMLVTVIYLGLQIALLIRKINIHKRIKKLKEQGVNIKW